MKGKQYALVRSALSAAIAALLLVWPFRMNAANLGNSGVTWIVDDMRQVRPSDATKIATAITVEAGRGEYVAVQPVIRAITGPLTNVRVVASPFIGPSTISVENNIEVYRESYINVPTSTPHKGGSTPMSPGWFPDALIPTNDPATGNPIAPGAMLRAQNASVAIGESQPYWIDIFIPPGTSPGDYTGTVTVTSDQGNATLNIALKVWGFELPLKPSLKSSFGMVKSRTEQDYITVINHRLQPRGAPAQYYNELNKRGMYLNDLGFFSQAGRPRCSMEEPPSSSTLQNQVNSHPPGVALYNYTADEIGDCSGLENTITQWGGALHDVGVKNLITMPPRSDLYSSVDIWPILPRQYVLNHPDVATVKAHGGEMWSYTAMNQDTYSPKWQIDFSPMNHRIYGFLNQSIGAEGVLYWAIDYWSSDPWTNPYSYQGFPGDGVLVYPGGKVGLTSIVPSMRLKYIRAAVQDYEYIEMLKKAGRGDWALLTIRTIAQDWRHWSDDPDELLQVRHTLGVELDRLAPSAQPH